MNPTGKNILAFVLGFVVMMAVNMGLIAGFSKLIPPPEGVDPSNLESVQQNIHRYEAKHFAPALIAHALGSIAGAIVATQLAASNRFALAMGLGVLHLAGGVAAAFMIPAPTWFIALDLIGAYLPMAYLGYKIATSVRPESPTSAA